MNDAKEILVQLLGLEASATEDSIRNSAKSFADDLEAYKNTSEAEATKLTNRVTELETGLAAEKEAVKTVTAEKDTIANTVQSLTEELAGLDVERFADVIENKDAIKAELIKNRAGTVAILSGLSNKVGKAPKGQPMFNRGKAGQPAPVVDGVATGAESAEAVRISNRASEIRKSTGATFHVAFNQARKEIEAAA